MSRRNARCLSIIEVVMICMFVLTNSNVLSVLLPREVTETDEYLQLEGAIQIELQHTLILAAGDIQLYGTGWWYIAVRTYGTSTSM